MFAANQMGLFAGAASRQQGADEGRVFAPEALALETGRWERGLRVDTAFARAERYLLELNAGRTLLAPVTAHDAGLRAYSSWVEYVPGWLCPEKNLFEALLADCNWRASQRLMYERVVDVPRMVSQPAPGARSTSLLQAFARLLSARYGRTLLVSSLALYRDGNDSVAPHGDKLGTLIPDTVVCILSLGYPRLFRLRPKSTQRGLSSIDFTLGGGDLFVMGGRCQAEWLHAVPKLTRAEARISVMFRERDPGSQG